MMMQTRCYSELILLKTLQERYDYLAIRGEVGRRTFGADRWLNQIFYSSADWKRIRSEVIIRDNGCDLGVDGYTIYDKVIIHHMNPIGAEDIRHGNLDIVYPEYLICVSFQTHQAIHFGNKYLLPELPKARVRGDTNLW